MESNSDAPRANGNWDAYWNDSGAAGAFSADGADHPALVGFWRELFEMAGRDNTSPRIVDLASGNGAVIAHALDVFDEGGADITAVKFAFQFNFYFFIGLIGKNIGADIFFGKIMIILKT